MRLGRHLVPEAHLAELGDPLLYAGYRVELKQLDPVTRIEKRIAKFGKMGFWNEVPAEPHQCLTTFIIEKYYIAMSLKEQLRGTGVAIITPFKSDVSIDF